MQGGMTFEMRCQREGLIVHVHVDKFFDGDIDLKKEYHLSDEEAKELLARLDERNWMREIADAECH